MNSLDRGASCDARNALSIGISRLAACKVPSSPLAAELLLMRVLDCDRAWLYAHPDHPLTAEQGAAYAALLEQRAAGMPTQYLTGRQEFWGMDFVVTPEVLIPRPETEHVVEVALDRLGGRHTDALVVADVGTGSGCLAVSLARELPGASIVATDISAAALDIARRNAERHGVAERVEFLRMSLLELYLRAPSSGEPRFDLIVSNPPYIARTEVGQLPREVREYEPHAALFAGETGMEIYAQLIPQAAMLLRSGSTLVLELGYNSAEPVCQLIHKQPGWMDLAIVEDLAGIPRVIAVTRV
jgi:release factor glutamine methyltransferase